MLILLNFLPKWKCAQFRYPSSREQNNLPSPSGRKSTHVSVKTSISYWKSLAEPQANLRSFFFLLLRPKCWGYGQPQGLGQWSLGDRGYRVVGGAHLGKNLIQPLQGTMQVNLNPAGCAGHILAVVLCSPSLKGMKTHHFQLFYSTQLSWNIFQILVSYKSCLLIPRLS